MSSSDDFMKMFTEMTGMNKPLKENAFEKIARESRELVEKMNELEKCNKK